MGRAARRAGAGARRRALGARAALRVGRASRGERAQVVVCAGRARSERGHRNGVRRRGRRVPPRVSARPEPGGRDRLGGRAARARP